MAIRSSIKVIDLSLWVHLGCTHEEQQSPQEIRVSFELRPNRLPEACYSDELKDTTCYGKLCDSVRRYCVDEKFRTIEKLAMGCFDTLRPQLPAETDLTLTVHKLKPPVDSLLGGASFTIESKSS